MRQELTETDHFLRSLKSLCKKIVWLRDKVLKNNKLNVKDEVLIRKLVEAFEKN